MTTRILAREQVRALVGMSRSTLYAEVQEGRFPAPIKTSPNRVGWVEAEIMEWIEQRKLERDLSREAAR